jgi:thiosulfate dehydrogenase [quinone] large subunit
VQKLSDPGFLHPGAPTYIGTQLRGFAHGTPGGFLLRAFALPAPKLAGVGVALLEIAIGLLVTAGLLTRVAAAAGLGLSLILFLTNSWHAYPYFLGSDIVFVFAWLPFVLSGASGQPALDAGLERLARSPRVRLGTPGRGQPVLSRRDVLVRALGGAGAATLGLAGLATLAKGNYRAGASTTALGTGGTSGGTSSHSAHAAAHHHARHAAPAQLPQGAVRLGPSSQIPSGGFATYRDPADGNPDIVIREAGGGLKAFSAVCTHAGCTVTYQGGQIICPCHGGTYDPRTGAVTGGPPPQGLAQRTVIEHAGEIYAAPS